MTKRGVVAVGAVVMAVLLCGCQWTSIGWDGSGSSNDTFDTGITIENASSLTPEWSGALYAPGTGSDVGSVPVAWADEVYEIGGAGVGSQLEAFSADGAAGCAGSPGVCSPRWVADGTHFTQPLVAGGVVYVSDFGTLEAFDAAGVTNCSGAAPTVCTPLWTGGSGSRPIFHDGAVYAADSADQQVVAYTPDALSCTGVPKVCAPNATYSAAPFCGAAPVCYVQAIVADGDHLYAQVVSQSRIPIGSPQPVFGSPLPSTPDDAPITFDEAVLAWTVGGPRTPSWQTDLESAGTTFPSIGLMDVDGHIDAAAVTSTSSDLAALDPATGTIDWTSQGLAPGFTADLDAVYARTSGGLAACGPSTGCGAATASDPLVPARTYDTGAASVGPIIVDGVIIVAGGGRSAGTDTIEAFDAAGTAGCRGAGPIVCEPIATIRVPAKVSQLSASNDRLYATTIDGRLVSFAIPGA